MTAVRTAPLNCQTCHSRTAAWLITGSTASPASIACDDCIGSSCADVYPLPLSGGFFSPSTAETVPYAAVNGSADWGSVVPAAALRLIAAAARRTSVGGHSRAARIRAAAETAEQTAAMMETLAERGHGATASTAAADYAALIGNWSSADESRARNADALTLTPDVVAREDGFADARAFLDYLTGTLIPDLRESGSDATADDFQTAADIIRAAHVI